MTIVQPQASGTPQRRATGRRYLMCRPDYFTVAYEINPWMDSSTPVDSAVALSQWEELRDTYIRLGHQVEFIDPVAGLPDMVFAANGATVVGEVVLGARFRFPQRAAEAGAYQQWFRANGFAHVTDPEYVNEGEGDLLVTGAPGQEVILAGTGFRTDPAAHAEARRVLGREVVTLELVDPRYYHLDTAIAVLSDDQIAWLPSAFAPAAQDVLRARFPGAIAVDEADAAVFGLNAVSDGLHVVLPVQAAAMSAALAADGFVPVPVDLSELRKGGGGPKCCTLEIRS